MNRGSQMPLTKKQQEEFRRRTQKQAVEAVAKRELLNFRVDADTIKRVYDVATNRKIGISELLREYMLAGLAQDEAAVESTNKLGKVLLSRGDLAAVKAVKGALHTLLEGQDKILEKLSDKADKAG